MTSTNRFLCDRTETEAAAPDHVEQCVSTVRLRNLVRAEDALRRRHDRWFYHVFRDGRGQEGRGRVLYQDAWKGLLESVVGNTNFNMNIWIYSFDLMQ